MSGQETAESFGIAIVGMAGRFPGAPDLSALWRNLAAGVESVEFFDDAELQRAGVAEELRRHPRYVAAGSVLDDIDLFDAGFFGYGPAEAALIDPQQRLLLECSWQALEDAGYDARAFAGAIGVFAGSTLSTYLLHLALHGGPVSAASAGPAFMGNAPDFLATRVAYKLDLQGPAYTVHTACSTSLVAVHLACQAMLSYETDIALAGGVSLRVPHRVGYLTEEGGITSPDGHTRPFDAAGRGTIFGNGAGMVVLRRLDDALADGDHVLAVIRGSATNNDGAVKVGFTAPSLGSQAAVIAEALAAADVDPRTVSYVEAHGTGTELGDPIEIAALTKAFQRPPGETPYCAVGSIKSNIGHLDAAAGISGLIKTVMMLRQRQIPPSLNFERPNPKIDFAASPFYVNTELRPWEVAEGPRRAGVSSFGFGGTNVHLVLEEAPAPPAVAEPPGSHLWLLSARSEAALAASGEALADHLESSSVALGDAAFTLQVGRRPFEQRRALVADDRGEAVAALRSGAGWHGACERSRPPLAFLFPGQGCQYPGMGRALYDREPEVRRWIDAAAEAMAPFDLPAALWHASADQQRDTALAQPAIFALEHALACLWMSWGLAPAALLGHSVGELVAATVAEVLPFEAACRLVVARGRAMAACEPGAMVALALSPAAAQELLPPELELLVVNGPEACVVGGPIDAVEAWRRELAVEHRPLRTSHAFHSRAMEAAIESTVASLAGGGELAAPKIPLISNPSGDWLSDDEARDPSYWGRQLRRPVRFGEGAERLLAEHSGALLEVGPGQVLASLVQRLPAARPVVASLPGPQGGDDRETLLGALGRLWIAGCEPDWTAVRGADRGRRVPLPTYPFERQRYWFGPALAGEELAAETPAAPEPVAVAGRHPRPSLATPYVAPESAAETSLADLWSEVLGVAPVGRHDDFFALGGDSLIATRMLARLQDLLGMAVPLDRLFAGPTVSELADRLAREDGHESAAAPSDGPRRVDRSVPLPLAYAQQRLWFLHHLDGTGAAYNLPGAMRLRGPLDAGRLEAALAAAVERHEALRTRFVAEAGEARQEILPTAELPLRRLELSAKPAEERLDLGLAALAEDARRPFDLGQAPLGRALWVQLDDRDGLFQLTLHHVVSDGWSWSLLRRELAAFLAGAEAPPPLAVQYADYAVWQRQQALDLDFWKQRLSPSPPPLDLPTDRPRPAEQSFRGETLPFALPAATVAAVEACAQEHGATAFMVLLASFEMVLARWSHQRTFAVGTPVANRSRSELEGVVGFFVNSLVLRADLTADPSLASLVAAVRDEALAAFGYQDVPFERLVDEVVAERSLGQSPLFQVMFGLHNTPPAGDIAGLEVEVLEPDTGTAKLDLTVGLLADGEGFAGTCEYASDLFDRATAERLLDHWRRLLDDALARPQTAFGDLALLSASERRQVVEEWNATAEPLPETTLHGLFEAQAARSPAAPCVLFEGRTLTFGELDQRATALAQRLRRHGVGAESRVGIHLERSVELMIALLAVLKAGGAYVPLDPEYPAARLRDMAEQADLALILAADEEDELFGRPALRATAESPPAIGDDRELPRVDPQQLAYVIFTSGSTGRPKGAMNSHRAIVNRLLWMQQHFRLGADDVVLQKTPISFDVSVWELFWPLLTGARLVLARPGGHRDGRYLVDRIVADGVTTLHFVPAMLQAFLEAPEASCCGGLRRVVCSGEALPFDLEQRFFAALPEVELHNLYGPTEAAVDVTAWRCRPDSERRPVAIGRPIHNLRIYLLDRRFRPVPVGVAGELWIGGVGLARGYIGRPAMTADRFRPDPFAADGGGRLYRTGDLARFLPEGDIDYLGRVDHQVKVRGFRIELGEIEAVLTEHPAVREAAVLARQDGGASARLVAYLTNHGEVDEAALRQHLGERLPDHMVPAAFVFLEAFPLSPNGKLDRRALPEPQWRAAEGVGDEAPRAGREELLAGIWRDVLGVDEVGRGDSFFRLGGDSISSLQVVARAGAAGLRLEARSVFQHPTLAALAAAAEEVDGSLPEQGPVVGEQILSPIQRWYFETAGPVPQHWNQSVLLDLDDGLEVAPLIAAWSDVLAHHDGLRARFRAVAGPSWQARIAAPGELQPIAVYDLANPEDPAYRAALAAIQGSLDLAEGPLVGVGLLRFASGGGRLLIAIHHLVIDGYSWRPLLEDLWLVYAARRRGEGPVLPPKTTSFEAWSRTLAEQDLPAPESDFWQDAEASAAEPCFAQAPAEQEVEAAVIRRTWELSEGTTEALVGSLAAATGARPDELLLAGLARALGELCERTRLRIDLEGHGRDLPLAGVDLSRTVGWFTALYPLNLDLSAVTTAADLVRTVKQRSRSVPSGGTGYLRWRRDSAPAASAEVLFNYLGRLDGLLPEDCPWRPIDADPGPQRAPSGRRRYALEVDAAIFEGRLRMTLTFVPGRVAESLAADLGAATLRFLEELVATPPAAPWRVPAEFPLADLDGAGLDRVLAWEPALRDLYPLTPVQEGMLFHSLYRPGEGVFVEQLVCDLGGDLDRTAFEDAWRVVAERHPVLATSFQWQDLPRPHQVVGPAAAPALEVVEELDLEADRRRGFDLSRAPLMRLALTPRPEDGWRLVWTFHHLILDGWSAAQVMSEVLTLYRGRRATDLPTVAPFRDYVAWLAEGDDQAEEDYWRGVLGDFSAATPLGVDRPAGRPSTRGDYGGGPDRGRRERTVESALVTRLEHQARCHGLTFATLLQGAWGLVLSRYSGQRDVLFGATVAGRPAELPGVEALVGLFINTLPVRLQLAADATVGEWLEGLQAASVERRRWEHAALGRVQGCSAVAAGEPLFESLLVIENYPFDEALLSADGLVQGRPEFREQTNDPLVLVVTPGRQLELRVGYDRERLTDAAAAAVLGHFEQALEELGRALEAETAIALGDLSLLTAEERHQVLEAWNRPPVDYRADGLLHHATEGWAQRMPEAVAVWCEGRTLTYGELNALANRLAHRLIRLGVVPDQPVGVSLERSPELVAALLGISKAGGAYVPLDPAYPEQRRRQIAADVGLELLVAADGAGIDGLRTVSLAHVGGEHDHDPRVDIGPENLAYIIHTSGSTGRPKGVMIPHRGVVNRLTFAPAAGHLRSGDRFLHKASISFDVSVLEIFLPLLAGGRVVMARPGGHQEPSHLAALVRDQGVHQGIFTPSLLRLLLDEEAFAEAPALHSVASSAEALPVDLRERFFAVSSADLYNRYGPTEASIAATSWHCLPEAVEDRVPIGRPIARARIYVVDDQLRPVPAGVPGELLIGGPGLARGYLRRPALTGERFVPDPFASHPGARLYRTGDRVRWRADGAIEFLGRIDHQVKVRGHRVEPGEIEAVLESLPGVEEGLVVDRPVSGGHVRLVAYVRGAAGDGGGFDGGGLDGGDLRRLLGEVLPEYMVPSAVVVLTDIPRTPNGKVDRRALPDPDWGSDQPRRQATTPAEESLVAVWQQVLGVPEVGVDDDFFELGGDSILSIRVVAKARQAGFEVSVRQIFEERTVARLAAVAGSAAATRAEQGPVVGEAPLTPIQRRFLEQPGPAPGWFNQALVLELRQAPEAALLEAALGALLSHHDALRGRFELGEDGWSQSFGAPLSAPVEGAQGGPLVVSVELAGLAPEQAEERFAAAAEEAQRSLDLEHGPLLRAVLATGPEPRLLLVIHHLVVDGVSWRILAEDLETAWSQLAAGEEVRLPPKTTSFKAWADWLAEASRFATEGDFWARQGKPVMALPQDSPQADFGVVGEAEEVVVTLPPEDTEKLLSEVPKAYDTGLDDALLATLGRTLAAWSGGERVRVDVEAHGREELSTEIDLTRTVGWLTALYPLTLAVAATDGVLDSLVAVKELRRSVPSGGLGHGFWAERRRAAGQPPPVAEVSFNYLGLVAVESAPSDDGSAWARPAAVSPGPTRHPGGSRRHRLEVEAQRDERGLTLRWRFDPANYRRDTLLALAESQLAELRALIAACQAPGVGGYTPSDFPDVDLDQDSLDSILSSLGDSLGDEGGVS
ncbi:MAG: amino acid adenylation domain-containing protein [Acidobacteriota bacterium]